MPTLLQASQALFYAGALTNATVASIAILISAGRSHKTASFGGSEVIKTPKHHIVSFFLILITYLAELAVTGLAQDTAANEAIVEARIVHVVLLIIIWSFVWRLHKARASSVCILVLCTSVTTLIFDTPQLVLSVLVNDLRQTAALAQETFQATRIIPLLFLATYHAAKSFSKSDSLEWSEESQPFLVAGHRSSSTQSYGAGNHSRLSNDSTAENEDGDDDDDGDSDEDVAEIKKERARRIKEKGGWWGYITDFKLFLPFLIPKNDRKVQFSLFICVMGLIATRIFNVLVPRQLGIVADQLLARENPIRALAIWMVLDIMSYSVLLDLVITLGKIPIRQFSYRSLTNAAFNHVLALPMEFHSDRDSAEVMKAIEQGEALTNVLDTFILDILPTIIDLIIAFAYLYSVFNSYVALAMAVAATTFMAFEMHATNWNLDNRRLQTKAKREEVRVMHQAVQGWQTVTYFNMFSFERRRFAKVVDDQLKANRDWAKRDAYIQLGLDLMVPLTFFTLGSLVIQDIIAGRSSPGGFVFLIQYWEYLIWPLKYLSHNYRFLLNDLVDAERLLYLLQTKPSITDKPNARTLPASTIEGAVEFKNVSFSYDPTKRQIIHDFNLSVLPGQTVAFVGETGAGKSSIMKLLLRFYDVTSGSISIDGHDIRDITLSSVRTALGVVPQDPLLFNASIRENLRYARPVGGVDGKNPITDEEMFAACKAAAIHDKILTFTDGYDTKVGESGVKLSGGEVQRLAIARVFLKDPPILILDEATSAVDTNTESSIRAALETLQEDDGGRKKTMFIVAHRLSTVVNADVIIVMHEGRIAEMGTHRELLGRGGRYKELWEKQVAIPIV